MKSIRTSELQLLKKIPLSTDIVTQEEFDNSVRSLSVYFDDRLKATIGNISVDFGKPIDLPFDVVFSSELSNYVLCSDFIEYMNFVNGQKQIIEYLSNLIVNEFIHDV